MSESKSFQVTVQPSGHTFSVNEDELILDAALRQGIGFPYGCRGGACGTCLGTVVDGEVEYPKGMPLTVSEEDHKEGKAVFCVCTAKSDLKLEVKEISSSDEVEIKKLPARVESLEKLSRDVMLMKLKLAESERLAFYAGQYIEFILKDNSRRAFSLANSPNDDSFLELHIRNIEGGSFTDHVFDEMKEKAIVRIEGPFGSFYVRDKSNRPLIFIAGGTGFAPIKSMLEHLFDTSDTRVAHVYWGANEEADLYQNELAETWAEKSNIYYVPVLSGDNNNDWQGKSGFVHETVLSDFPDLSGYDVYAAGPPPMIDAIKEAFAKQGLPEDQLFFDSFDFAERN